MSITLSTVEPPEELLTELDSFLRKYQRSQTAADKVDLFDQTIQTFCEEIALALDAEIAVWSANEEEGRIQFGTILSGPKIRFNDHSLLEDDLDQIFSRKLIAEQRISHGETLLKPNKMLKEAMKRSLGVSVTALLCEPVGSDDTIPCLMALYRFSDETGKDIFSSPGFSDDEILRANLYTSVLNRLLQYGLYTKALQ